MKEIAWKTPRSIKGALLDNKRFAYFSYSHKSEKGFRNWHWGPNDINAIPYQRG